MVVIHDGLCLWHLKDCVPEAGLPWSRQAMSVLELLSHEG